MYSIDTGLPSGMNPMTNFQTALILVVVQKWYMSTMVFCFGSTTRPQSSLLLSLSRPVCNENANIARALQCKDNSLIMLPRSVDVSAAHTLWV